MIGLEKSCTWVSFIPVPDDMIEITFSRQVSVSAPLPSGSEYSLELDLCHPINPAQSSFRVVPSKVSVPTPSRSATGAG